VQVSFSELLAKRLDVLDQNSQTSAAALLKVAQSTLGRWLSGQLVPSDQSVPKLAAFLEVPETELASVLYADRKARKLDRSERLTIMEDQMEELSDAVSATSRQLVEIRSLVEDLRRTL